MRASRQQTPKAEMEIGLHRIFLEKVRRPYSFLAETGSHLILFIFMAIVYLVFKVTNFDGGIHSQIVMQTSQTANPLPTITATLSGPLPTLTLKQYLNSGEYLYHHNYNDLRALSNTYLGSSLDFLLGANTLYFAPNTSQVRSLIASMELQAPQLSTDFNILVCDSDDSAIRHIDMQQTLPWAVIVLDEISQDNLQITIRLPYDPKFSTKIFFVEPRYGFDPTYQNYEVSGFLSLQHAIDIWMFNQSSSCSIDDLKPRSFVPFPNYAYKVNSFYNSVGALLGIYIVLSLVYPITRFASSLVEDKERGIKSLLLSSGMNGFAYESCWLIVGGIIFVWVVLSSALITFSTFFLGVDFALLLLIFTAFMSAMLSVTYFFALFFNNSRLVTILIPILMFVTTLPRFAFMRSSPTDDFYEKLACCLFPPCALAFAVDIIEKHLSAGVNVNFDNWATPHAFDINYGVIMLAVDIVLYALLSLFVFALAKLRTKGWLSWRFFTCNRNHGNSMSIPPTIYEPNNEESEVKVVATNLSKRFPNGVQAVESVSLSLLENQVTCLLGQNGAGKSTLMKILTGDSPPTSGHIKIYGCDFKSAGLALKKRIGICRQENTLFRHLTVKEQLLFFALLRRRNETQAQDEVREMLQIIGLDFKQDEFPSQLSGGMKRKLCLAIALIGQTSFVVLDEPSSGMDPTSRRNIWNILQGLKAGRTILLSTHFTEEAETVSDRIAIMAKGRNICVGSPLFLKAALNRGYFLTMKNGDLGPTRSSLPMIEHEIKSIISDANLQSMTAGEMVYNLPVNKSTLYGRLFRKLKEMKTFLNLRTFGISGTSLEQVFLSLMSDSQQRNVAATTTERVRRSSTADTTIGTGSAAAEEGLPSDLSRDTSENDQIDIEQQEIVTKPKDEDSAMCCQSQMRKLLVACSFCRTGAVLKRRITQTRRDIKGLLFQILLPLIAFGIGIVILLIQLNPLQPALPLTNVQFTQAANTIPTVLYPQTDAGSIMLANVTLQSIDNVANSTAMSEYLLHEYATNRYGAVIYNDSLPLLLQLNFTWLKQHPAEAELIYQVAEAVNAPFPPQLLPRSLQATVAIDSAAAISKKRCSNLLTGNPWRILTAPYLHCLPNGADAVNTTVRSPLTIMHNSTAIHAIAIFNAEMTAAEYRLCSGNQSATYTVINHPLPITQTTALFDQITVSIIMVTYLIIPLSYLPASFVSNVVRERVIKSRHMQTLAGLTSWEYWLGNSIWDALLFSIPIVAFVISLLIIGGSMTAVFVGTPDRVFALLLLLLCYDFVSLLLAYLFSMAFTDYAFAMIIVLTFNFATGFGFVAAYYVLTSQASTKDIALQIADVLLIFPAFNVAQGLINMTTAYYFSKIRKLDVNYFSNSVIGKNLWFMVIEIVIFFALLLILESRFWVWFRCPNRQVKQIIERSRNLTSTHGYVDSDVQDEESLVYECHGVFGENFPLVVRDLHKVYDQGPCSSKRYFHALRGVTIACTVGERFGLLGLNGAGKSSTLNILTGETTRTVGDVFISGKMLSINGARGYSVGYCPQEDPIWDTLNAFETLRFYARIHGMHGKEGEEHVQSLLKQIGLMDFARFPSGTYSGGNKRKLSLAIALIGNPAVLLLDEPSTGMDPGARRQMWNIIHNISENRTVVLVSHSMEEIEALCTRVGVLVAGRLQCLGSVQHLKSKFGTGYQIEIRCDSNRLDECLDFCNSILLPESLNSMSGDFKAGDEFLIVEERYGGYARLRAGQDLDLSVAFDGFEQHKYEFGIHDYSISQGSLDRVFIQTNAEYGHGVESQNRGREGAG